MRFSGFRSRGVSQKKITICDFELLNFSLEVSRYCVYAVLQAKHEIPEMDKNFSEVPSHFKDHINLIPDGRYRELQSGYFLC